MIQQVCKSGTAVAEQYVRAGATVSICGKYRYRLWREWRLHPAPALWDMWTDEQGEPICDGEGKQLGEPLVCVFIMLNPSTADGEQDDPTIRRCVAFAKAWGFDAMEVVNLFAYRATDPRELLRLNCNDDPWGPENREAVMSAVRRAGKVVCAWGAHGGHLEQDEEVFGWIEDEISLADREIPICALKLTKDRYPSHPLYLKADVQPFPYAGRKS